MARTVFILFTTVVPRPRPVPGLQLALDTYVWNENRDVWVTENRQFVLSLFPEVSSESSS